MVTVSGTIPILAPPKRSLNGNDAAPRRSHYMAKATDRLDNTLQDAREIEHFLHSLLPALDERELRQGEDVLRHAKRLKLSIPEVLRGEDVTWETDHSSYGKGGKGGDTLVIATSGQPDAVGLVIKCVNIKKWRFCLECGFLWCRIVVSRRF